MVLLRFKIVAQAYADVGKHENALTLLQAIERNAPPEFKPMVQAKLNELQNPQPATADTTPLESPETQS